MRKSYSITVVAGLLALAIAGSAFAVEPFAIREADGVGSGPPPCDLSTLDGDCANYSNFNLCAGYIWIFSGWVAGEGVGTRFGSDLGQACVAAGNVAVRSVTYFRNVVPLYNQTVDIYLDDDANWDGCPDANLASDLDLDPGLRWNCSEFNTALASGGAIVRQLHDGGSAPTFSTEGPFTQTCDPVGQLRSYYYGVNGSQCLGWVGPTGRFDNWLTFLVINASTATENTSWGAVKGLYQ